VYKLAMVEDEIVSSDRVEQLLQTSWQEHETTRFHLAWHARSCAQAQNYIQQYAETPDVLLLDLGLPDGRGVDLIPNIRRRWPRCAIVAFTVFGDQSTVLEAIEAGVDGYLLKTTEADELLDTLISAVKGESPISSAVAGFLLRRLRKTQAQHAPSAEQKTDVRKTIMTLTTREHEVLESLARGYSYRETARRLGMSQHTVSHHVKNLYPKLVSTSRSEAVFRALQEGIIKLD
jgi:DNA-binding NarL/FixJ family response regulator